MTEIIIATRKSALALWQANYVKDLLEQDISITVRLNQIVTKGDKILDKPLAEVGGKGLFIKELEKTLIDKQSDIAVHSLKDVAYDIPEELYLSAICKRDISDDVLISKNKLPLSKIRKNGKIGTSSLRRKSQLLSYRDDLEIVPLRGNLQTRLKKLEESDLDGIVLAAVGLKRLLLEDMITEYLPEDIFLPSAGQGVIAIESRKDDKEINVHIKRLDNKKTRLEIEAERAFVAELDSGCHAPIAAYAELLEDDIISFKAMILSADGKRIFRKDEKFHIDQRFDRAKAAAKELLEDGAKEIIDSLKPKL